MRRRQPLGAEQAAAAYDQAQLGASGAVVAAANLRYAPLSNLGDKPLLHGRAPEDLPVAPTSEDLVEAVGQGLLADEAQLAR